MISKENRHIDYLCKERIKLLLDEGYYGFKIVNLHKKEGSDSVIVETANHSGITLYAKGRSKEDACLQMIDLIDTTIDDL